MRTPVLVVASEMAELLIGLSPAVFDILRLAFSARPAPAALLSPTHLN